MRSEATAAAEHKGKLTSRSETTGAVTSALCHSVSGSLSVSISLSFSLSVSVSLSLSLCLCREKEETKQAYVNTNGTNGVL